MEVIRVFGCMCVFMCMSMGVQLKHVSDARLCVRLMRSFFCVCVSECVVLCLCVEGLCAFLCVLVADVKADAPLCRTHAGLSVCKPYVFVCRCVCGRHAGLYVCACAVLSCVCVW